MPRRGRRRTDRGGTGGRSHSRGGARRRRARPSTRRTYPIGLGIFLFALAVRIGYLVESADNPTFDIPISDAGTYHQMARSLVAGRPMGEDFFWQPVFYPAFLTAAHLLSGSSLVFVKAIQALLGAVTCVLVYLLGRRVFDRRTGGLAAFITALYGPLIFFEGEPLAAGWAAFWAVALILLFLRAEDRQRPSTFLALGICGALAVLTRPTFLLFFAAACAWLVLSQYRVGTDWRGAARALAALLAGFCLTLTPVAVQNHRVTGQFTVLPASGWLNAYLGNNPDACRTIQIRPGEEWDRLNLGPELPHSSARSSDKREWSRSETLDYVRTQPLSFLNGLAHKSVQFVSPRELPRNVDLYLFRQWSGLLGLLAWKVGGFGFIPAPLILFAVLYPLSIILVFVTARYRVPVVPVLAIPAAGAVMSLRDMIRERRTRQLALAGGCAVAAAFLSALPGPFCQEETSYESELYRSVGAARARRGEIQEAIVQLSRAAQIDPANFDAHNDLSMAFDQQGKFDLAAREARLALQIRPDSAAAHTNLANALTSLGRVGEALPLYRRTLELQPAFPGAYLNLANALMEQGHREEALVYYRRELEHRPDFPEAHYLLAGALLTLDRTEEAIVHYRRVLELDPNHSRGRQALRAALGRRADRP
jgi:tetratricopeptide (TPR) repeat protein